MDPGENHKMSIQEKLQLGARHFHGLKQAPAELVADACVIGSGASGAVVANALQACGWSVIMVEEGNLLTPKVTQEEVDSSSPMAEIKGENGWEERGWSWSTRNVGGGTLFYGGASFRYQDCDFDARSWLSGIGLDIAWPIHLTDLEKYYAIVEEQLRVSGGPHTASAKEGGNALPRSLPADIMAAAAKQLGYHPFTTPMAIDPKLCTQEKRCIDFQCPSGAKSDVLNIYIKRLVNHCNFTLLSGIRGVALEQERSGQISTLRCLDLEDGSIRHVKARYFFVACNAIQSAALLLRSVTPFAPNGIGNRHDLVGRGLCMKLSQRIRGVVPVTDAMRNHAVGLRGPFSTLAILDHYLDARCPSGMGGLIYEARTIPVSDEFPELLPLELEAIIADTPAYENRVKLSSRRDVWGIPKIMIDYQTAPHDLARLSYMAERAVDILHAAGATQIHSKRTRSEEGSTHLHGTCRSGTDPSRSVLDPNCRVHELENLYIVDGSFMPFPGGLNPTLTIQANALRVAQHVVGVD
ncbi:GMC oxidoreductase [Photorhabdus laumondii subsp. clarkei]|uniref:GMC oxidoreductase n=2 Tax=Photorhabdus TaxID=29487 RepID=A0A329VAJ9_9GAMM|nr:GMC oxidoreductase [Photorhabdus laumondii subsp. clarkei]